MKVQGYNINIEKGKTGLFYATSPDLKGLLVAEPTMEALEQHIPKAIKALESAKTWDDTTKALFRLYLIVQKEMKDWMIPKPSKDELRDAMEEAKQILYQETGCNPQPKN